MVVRKIPHNLCGAIDEDSTADQEGSKDTPDPREVLEEGGQAGQDTSTYVALSDPGSMHF